MQKLQPGLYVVATPIGQLADTSERAKQVLSGVELKTKTGLSRFHYRGSN